MIHCSILRCSIHRDGGRGAGIQICLTGTTSVPCQTTYGVLMLLSDHYCVDWSVVVDIGYIKPCTQQQKLSSPARCSWSFGRKYVTLIRTSLCAKRYQAIVMHCHVEDRPAQQTNVLGGHVMVASTKILLHYAAHTHLLSGACIVVMGRLPFRMSHTHM